MIRIPGKFTFENGYAFFIKCIITNVIRIYAAEIGFSNPELLANFGGTKKLPLVTAD